MGKLRILVHNCIAHPLAGLLWVAGMEDAADWVHGFCAPTAVELD